jgi:acyl-CoA synthetase (AMP-forming)/AMP-acid ligase II
MSWPFAAVLAVAEQVMDPGKPALAHGPLVRTWGELKGRSDALAGAFVEAGAPPGAKVAHYMRNRMEYLETSAACWKAGLTHVNVNYRYTENELFYIFDNSDAEVIVYAEEFAPQVAALQPRLQKVRLFVEVNDAGLPQRFAQAYEALVALGRPAPERRFGQDDLLFIYTGGTTGLPKGVMWRQTELWAALGGGSPAPGMPAPETLEAFEALLRQGQTGMPTLICAPLMHGAGYLIAVNQLLRGGTVVTAEGASFNAESALDAMQAHKTAVAAIVGDAFGRPLARALEAHPNRWDLSATRMIISSGAMWSSEAKALLGKHMPGTMLLDALGSSEVMGMGMAATPGAAAAGAAPARFMADARTKVITDDGREVTPGSGDIGRIFRGGPIPLGYYKDPEKSGRTFMTFNGARYAVPGDYATIEADGTINLIGRGSQVINTGGEKVFVEEVEETLKTHPAVEDALVFGMADEKWGQAVTAVVETVSPVTAEELVAHLRRTLAPYKSPKNIIFATKCPRGPNGKANYEAARALASAG